MSHQKYKCAVSSVFKAQLGNIKKDKESPDELYNKLVTLIYTCIVTQVTATGALVGIDTAITQGGIYKHKLVAIDAYHQIQWIVNHSHNFTYLGNKGKKWIAAGITPHLKYFFTERIVPHLMRADMI